MSIVRIILCQSGQECSNTTDEYIPSVNVWMKDINVSKLVILCAGAGMTGVVICLGLLHLTFVLKFVNEEKIRTDLYWLVFMPPAVAFCGLVGMVLPRSAIFLYAIALVYYMICIFVLVSLMCTLNGSRTLLCNKLLAKGKRLSIRIFPLGCCLFCFDKLTPTEKNFRRCEWLVFQSPIVRILLEILNITVYMELNNRSNLFFQLSNLIGLISLLVGTYGSYIIVPAGASLLRKYRLLLLFRLVDVSQELWSVQKLIADLLCAFKVIQPSKDLDPTPKAQFFISFLLCLEMLLASVLATFLFHPSHCALFDRLRPNQNDVGGDTKSDDISLLSDRANSERKA
ncbi:hypothetical protein GPALN_007977 [Globodera pallida]|nr:hypothetical protein GPALN_007977 [Globodera pallida]